MAIRRNNVLGQTSGKLGNTVTRIRYGKEVVYALPDKVKISQSKPAKAARSKFALTVSFAKYINSIPALSSIWANAKIPGTNSYQKLIKHNFGLTGENNLTINNIISPAEYNLIIKDLSYEDNKYTFSIDLSKINLALSSLLPMRAHSILYFYEPKQNNEMQFSFLHLSNEINSIPPDNKIEIPFGKSTSGSNIPEHFHKLINFITVLSDNENSINSLWSNTISLQTDSI